MRIWWQVLPLLWLAACQPGGAPRPNLLVISIDTLRADHVGAYGYGRPTTPHIDALAAGAARFENAISVMPTTLPSHVAALTGVYPWRFGVTRNGLALPPEASTLAELLRERGYATAAFVSAVPLHASTGLDQGFEVYDDGGPGAGLHTRAGRATVEAAAGWLRTQSGPFFAFVHLFDPHTPYAAPEPYRSAWSAPERPQPPEFEFLESTGWLTPEQGARAIAAYDAEVAYADAAVGALLDRLDDGGWADDTVVCLMADHGETLAELALRYGYAFDHGEFLYRRELRVPLIVRVPGEAGAAVHEAPVSLVDLTPTLLELLGLTVPPGLDGRSLVPLLRGEGLEPTPVYSQRRSFETVKRPFLRGQAWSLVTAEWHLIASDHAPPELYLAEDLAEVRDLTAAEPERTRALLAELGAVRSRSASGAALAEEVPAEVAEQLRRLGYAR